MKKYEKTGNGIPRMVVIAAAVLIQAVWIILRAELLNAYSETISVITAVLALTVVLKINSKYTNSAMKIPWIMLIMAFPVMGLCMYLLVELLDDPGVSRRLRAVRKHLRRDDEKMVAQNLAQLTEQVFAVCNAVGKCSHIVRAYEILLVQFFKKFIECLFL